jgi:glycosyltransferase involved in cell wall biosynthesis
MDGQPRRKAIVSIGVVVIGRNEGERLRKCLTSVRRVADRVVYVDSGSTDGSVAMARGMGLDVVELDLSTSFTAARARNDGFSRLLESAPDLAYIQFVDGDCEIVDGWLETAAAFLNGHDDIVMVCGRLRERYPERSVFNLLCDIEWDTPVGASKACGGIAMVRTGALKDAGGYRADLIAGEEPELCVRLRAAGGKVWRLDTEMALHDAAMTSLAQWWKRALRGGYAFAEGSHLHGAPPERHCVKQSRSIRFWGGMVPLATFAAALVWGPWGLTLLAIYPLQVVRLAMQSRRSTRENWWWAVFMVLGRFPEMLGQLKYWWNRVSNKTNSLIEYK